MRLSPSGTPKQKTAKILSADTPLFRQYHGIKQQHPDKLLFFRMGDFFELFYSDAEKVAALLGLNLTARRTSDERIPMAGVPVGSYEQYLSRLVRLGESVAVCDQVGSTTGKGLMEREVTQIVTPGTLTDLALLPERSASLAMALAPGDKSTGYAWIDLARGELRAGECAPTELVDHFARLRPAEVILPEGSAIPQGVSASLQHLPPWEFDSASTTPRLLKHFSLSSLDGLGLADKPQAAAAMMALIGYVEHTQCRPLDNLWQVGAEHAGEHVALDAPARRSLEITMSLTGDGPTLCGCLDSCRTMMGSRLLMRRLDNPLRSLSRLNSRLDAIDAVSASARKLGGWIEGCSDLERIVSRVRLKTVRPRELVGLREALLTLPELARMLAKLDVDLPQRFVPLIKSYEEQERLLTSTLAQEPQSLLRNGGVIAAGHSAELDGLRNIQQSISDSLEKIVDEACAESGFSVNSGHNRIHGYYLELPRSQSERAPSHWRRLQTTKHAERYKTDELREMDERADSADDKAIGLELQLYADLVLELAKHGSKLCALAEALAELDVSVALAGIASERGWVRPQLAERPGIMIEQGRHPVVEQTVEHFVANDIDLQASRRLHVLTGPNMGGKSTYMRQVALIALLAHTGSPVPAKSASIGLLDSIMTRIGAGDQLALGLSTFMVEMVETAAILNNATPATLVLLDEIGRGTSTYDGLSLAWATAQTLLERNEALVLLSTHYLELADLAQDREGAINMHLAVDDTGDRVVMLHRVEGGALDRSFGLHVASMAGVPRHCTELAHQIFDQLGTLKGNEHSGGIGVQKAAAAPPPNPALARLRESDPDSLSPREAQELLYELRRIDQSRT